MKCPFCGKNLGSRPQSSGVVFASSTVVSCDNDHERIVYSSLMNDWSTKSEFIADNLSKRGYIVRKDGDLYCFEA